METSWKNWLEDVTFFVSSNTKTLQRRKGIIFPISVSLFLFTQFKEKFLGGMDLNVVNESLG